jgi:hypothetical protein
LVAEYPIEPAGHGDYSAEFYQDFHDKPIINGFAKGSLSEQRALQLGRLDDPLTAGRLRMLGVRYVVLNHGASVPGSQRRERSPRGLRALMRGADASLYSVRATPVPLVTMGTGFRAPEGTPQGMFQWLDSEQGEIEVRAPCSPCSGRLEVLVKSFARPRAITMRGPDGRTLAVRRVGLKGRRLAFPIQFNRQIILRITTNPGPEPVAPVLHNADPRSVSVSLVQARLNLGSKVSTASK